VVTNQQVEVRRRSQERQGDGLQDQTPSRRGGARDGPSSGDSGEAMSDWRRHRFQLTRSFLQREADSVIYTST
jgi:hypothetical protein